MDKGAFLINLNTVLIPHVEVYFEKDWRSSNTPFINSLTIGNCPNETWLFSKQIQDDSMVLNEHYDKPALNKSHRKSKARGNAAEIQSH